MKLLFFIDELGSGGAQRQMVNLALEFKDLGHSITFLTYRRSDFYEKVLIERDIEVINIPEEGGYFNRLQRCRKIIRTGQYDSVLAFLEGPCFIAEVASFPSRKWKLVVGERSANPAIMTSIKQKLYRILHFRADHVIANSQCNINMVLQVNPFLKKNKCGVIYNLYDLSKFEVNEDYVYKKDNKIHIVIPANLRYWKNLEGLVEGVNLLSDSEKKQLKIAWYGHEFEIDDSKKKAVEKIKKYQLEDVFTFYPPTKEILPIMSNADAVGLFSHFEGLSNTICEAMALGKPIITTKVSDNEVFIKDKETGFLCESKDFDSIARALSALINSEATKLSEMGRENRQIFEKLFDRENILQRYLKLLNK
ncbi:glycosyltransferase family 4 protein [Myroides profundi]|uniref:Glycosyltransferase involved in cell wall bisynthesis n=1 Tax=Myroides profundi TaxID=480520 RepID=A0AAJ5BFI1_MYRPR|nr:glycosyltransferase family 4 protein [Myroides profundi]AJH15304.1 glycosyltransferase [Myroides profundi]SER65435.1 Glycosyltransferase involved in cell wall bisynthesis [Myroides profundi]